jgi:glycosyltransferase involved in cell wall biosynthesis
MKLLYACADRADDPHHWSGTVWNCRRALEAAGVTLAVFDRIPFECPRPLRLLHQLHKRLGRKTHYLQIEPAVLRRAARRIAERFARGDCDAVFCPGTGVPVHAYVPAAVPVFAYLDATKRSWIATYFGLGTLSTRSRRHVDEADRAGLRNNTRTFFSSDWAMAEAARDYGVPPGRMAVVPFGANLAEAPARPEVEAWIAARRREPLRLLFLGKEWIRKGGPEALALIRALRAGGLPATLDIVGCVPALDANDRALTRVHGFIDHSSPDGGKLFHALLREAHVLLFLSRAEAYGIALCEAAAFGVPACASDVGGIPTIVRHGVTGWLARTPFSPGEAAATLAAAWRSPDQYRRIALAARADFEARLNWQVAGRSLKTSIEQALARRAVASVA